MALPKLESFTTGSDQDLEVYDVNWKVAAADAGDMDVYAATDDCGASGRSVYSWGGDVFDNGQYAVAKFSTVGTGVFGVGVRCSQSAATGYYFIRDGSSSYFGKAVAGSFTDIGGNRGTFVQNDTIEIRFNETTGWDIRRNGVSIATGTDASIASGYAGMIAYSGGTTRLDDWEGGNTAAGGLSIPVAIQNMRGGFNPIGMRGGFIN